MFSLIKSFQVNTISYIKQKGEENRFQFYYFLALCPWIMHLFKYFNRVCVCEIDALLANILGQDKTAWMFWNWVKAEEFPAFGSSSGFLESSLRLWCPCFYGLIKRAKSWEVCRGKHLRLRCAPRSVPWPDGEPALWSRDQGPDGPSVVVRVEAASSKAAPDSAARFHLELYSGHQMVAGWEASWKSVYFSASQAVLTLSSPSYLWRPFGIRLPSMEWLNIPVFLSSPLGLIINNSCNLRWKLLPP